MSQNRVFTPLGASNHSMGTREINDFYATDPRAIDALLTKIQLPQTILEPCCGSGCLSQRLEQYGHHVISEDLIYRGYGIGGKDFFQRTKMPKGCSCIVTNAPYKQAMECVLHALGILPNGGMLCMFLKTTFLEGQQRFNQLFSIYPPAQVLQFTNRIPCAKNADFTQMKSSAVSYAWFLWYKGWTGQPVLDWITY